MRDGPPAIAHVDIGMVPMNRATAWEPVQVDVGYGAAGRAAPNPVCPRGGESKRDFAAPDFTQDQRVAGIDRSEIGAAALVTQFSVGWEQRCASRIQAHQRELDRFGAAHHPGQCNRDGAYRLCAQRRP